MSEVGKQKKNSGQVKIPDQIVEMKYRYYYYYYYYYTGKD